MTRTHNKLRYAALKLRRTKLKKRQKKEEFTGEEIKTREIDMKRGI